MYFSNSFISQKELKGSGNWVLTLINEISKSNFVELSVAFHDPSVKKILFERLENLQLIRIPLLNYSNILDKLLSSWLIIEKYKNVVDDYLKVINNTKPDIIQIFGLESPYIRIIDKVTIPIIIHIQGFLPSYVNFYFSRFSSMDIIKYAGIRNIIAANLPFLRKKAIYKHIKIEKTMYKNIKYFLGRTDWDRLIVKAIAPDSKYFYCQEILREPFYKNIWSVPKNKKYVFYTTTSDAFYKNVDIIFETCNILETYHKKLKYEWRIMGVSNSDITPKVMKGKKKTTHNIKLLGKGDSNEIIRQLLNANIFIFPSAIENSPNALEEAMLVGIPIISTYGGGISSIIKNYETGMLINEGDPYSLAGAIIEILENYNKAIEMGKKAREIALLRHNPKLIVENLINIYHKI